MSYLHQNTFESIKREYEEVVALLSSLAEKDRKPGKGQKDRYSSLPAYDPNRLAAAVATANDAYALLLIATAEGFLRACLTSLGKPPGVRPTLNTLIDDCRKEFNKTKPRIPIRASDAGEVHDLRRQRNEYAHGYGSSVFPTVGRVVIILGRFFAQLP